jgi:hypothetical protein
MKLIKLLLTVAGATLLFGTLTSTASARVLLQSSQRTRATWTRFTIAGEFGNVECEVVLEASMNSSSMPKVVASVVGYITAGNVTRCARGGATVLRETLPWSLAYAGFTGRLPNISTFSSNITGFSLSVREPTFGITGLVRTGLRGILGWLSSLLTGVEIRITISGSCIINIGGTCTVNADTTNVRDGSGAVITVTLI